MAFGDFTVDRNSAKYVLGSGGSYVSYATDEPAFEFNSDGSYKGLLVEPASTNQIRNGSGTGAVVGTPGTLPTNWTHISAGLTQEEVAKKLNTKKTAVSRIENHAEDIKLSTIEKFTRAVGKKLKIKIA